MGQHTEYVKGLRTIAALTAEIETLKSQLAQAEARGRERALMGAIRTVADSIGYMDDATWNDACNHIVDHLRALKDNPHG